MDIWNVIDWELKLISRAPTFWVNMLRLDSHFLCLMIYVK
uniref:Uncharacterized protein n=1 Tax=Candidatus Kentrum sp. LPFa TaxID=2126335 RepID=A0A450X8X6_9GAMM|nr:MAG: hypothetical protein BECKLPF1236A_GA0070988_104931 [Candidatus Kentron sp. LPFa]VFK31462.1 MAG: hypothetical protein BECKLPF1236A_GA0070988_109021 [Candidatus Kentron sp. LPFa]